LTWRAGVQYHNKRFRVAFPLPGPYPTNSLSRGRIASRGERRAGMVVGKRRSRFIYRACFRPNQLEDMNQLGDSPSVDGRVLGYAQTWHRVNPDYNNRCIANEYISGRIGIFLGLPIPPFAITHDKDENVYFSSLDFNFNRAILPPIVPDRCVACLPELCTGILLFDILIANEDRHEANLVTDSVSSPKFIHVYDHDQALLSGRNSEGVRLGLAE